MDFERLVSPITDYLNFAISFWSGDFSILDPYKDSNEVLPEALLLSLVGIGFMLVVRYARFGSVPIDTADRQPLAPPLDTNSLMLFTLTGLVSPLLFEISFWIAGTRHYAEWSIATTFNACFLSFALAAPISGVQTRINYVNLQMMKVGPRIRLVCSIASVALACLSLYLILLTFRIYPVIFGVTVGELIPAAAIALGIFFSLTIFAGVCLFQWNKFLANRSS